MKALIVTAALLTSTAALAQQATPPTMTGPGSPGAQVLAAQGSGGQQASSPFVRRIQQQLAQQGYLSQSPSGSWDNETTNAVERFQDANGIEATGKIDEVTVLALGIHPGQGQMLGGQGGQGGQALGGPLSGSTGRGREIGARSFQLGYHQGFEQGVRQAITLMQGQQGQGQQAPQRSQRGGQQGGQQPLIIVPPFPFDEDQ